MSVPSYILNWDEFATELAKGITIDNVNIDTSGIEFLLETYFPEIVDLLENILEEAHLMRTKYDNYNQKIKGFSAKTDSSIKSFEFVSDKNMYLTGVSFSHNHLEGIGDYFNLSVENDKAELIFSEVSFKDALQHKHFNKFFPIPAGMKVKITHFNADNKEKYIWYDLEYLEQK